MTVTSALLVALLAACSSPARVTSDAAGDAPVDTRGDSPPDTDPLQDAQLDVVPDGPSGPVDGGDPFGGLLSLAPKCRNGWCWMSPKPSGTTYSRVFHTAPNNIWVIGGFSLASTVLQWTGTNWVEHTPILPAGSPGELFPGAISGSSPTNMWMIYGHTVQQWDGSTWTVRDIGIGGISGFQSLWVDPTTGRPWVTTGQGKLRRWDGSVWENIDPGCGCFLGVVWGTGSEDVFITSIGGLLHFDGQSFSFVYTGPAIFNSFVGIGRDVWISGTKGALARWDGFQVIEVDSGYGDSISILAVEMLAPDDVWWIAGNELLHWNGTSFTRDEVDLAASSGEDCCFGYLDGAIIDGRWWLVGREGSIYTKLTPTTLLPIVKVYELGSQVWGTSRDDLYFTSGAGITHWNGTSFTKIPVRMFGLNGVPPSTPGSAPQLFGTNRYSVGLGSATQYAWEFVHFDGVTWTTYQLTLPGPADAAIWSAKALGPNEALLYGKNGLALHFQSGAFTPVVTSTTAELRHVEPVDSDLHLVTSANGTLLQWRKSAPATMTVDASFPASTDYLDQIDIAGGVQWIQVPNAGYVWRKPAGGAWQKSDTQSTVHVIPSSIVAISADNVVIIGNDSTSAARWNGTSWVAESYPSSHGHQLYALADGTTYITNSAGVLIHD